MAQVIDPPQINCVTTDENNGDVSISWTPAALDPCGPFERYVIMGATNPGGPYQVVGTITDPSTVSFVHTGANGTVVDWYYIMFTEQDCMGATIDTSAEYSEEVFYSPTLEYVTVNSDGEVEIHWEASSSSQTVGYIISYFTGLAGNPPLPQYNAIDTVNGRTTIIFTDNGADPNSQSYSYSIQGVNGCGDETAYEPQHQTVYLSQPTSADPCDGALILEWNKYINWSEVLEYQIVYSVDSATPETISVNPESMFPSGSADDVRAQYDFPLDNISGNQICFNIHAIHEDGSPVSVSNELCLFLDQVSSTAYNYLTGLTVNANDAVELDWVIDTSADISQFLIKRGKDQNTTAIDSLAAGNPVAFSNDYTDPTAISQRFSYYYTVGSIDDCDLEKESTYGRTMLLEEIDNASPVENDLRWNAFEMENATVLSYKLFRINSSGNEVSLQDFSPSEDLFYKDEVGTQPSDDGRYCYVAEARYQLNIPGLSISEIKESRSNQLCIEQPPVIYIPNAFVPSGENSTFKPVLLFRELAFYEFMIFDRYGKRIFQTERQIAGWDGSYNGEKQPMGGYVYYLRVETLGGQVEERRGVVALIR
ncbi:MAG: T9SS type B sorting domain-containing protein [Chitinophagales bacterium]